ncbi:MAG: recombinase family protein [Candidatus Dormibacteraeota bacterium]|uniref:Recombinase family protein n=1 Tax=Candidatus Nephthysia bennettiae TaxID=3127016 RepID=A0A934N5R3_9BACT|nr:recombinase family protein [Candidatus Dormibacteraeota bacterium]
MPRRVALYARVSTEDRGQDPELQLVPMREHAAAHGWEAIDYVDQASASDLRRRRGWRQLLEDAHRHRFDVVMVWKLDRFARSALDALHWLEQLDGYGVGLKILTQDIDTTTSAGRLVFTVLAAVAEMERELIRERVKAGVERARSEGRQLGRPPRSAVEDLRRWPEVRDQVMAGTITRAEGARRLRVRYGDFLAALNAFRNRGGAERTAAEFSQSG